MAKRREQQAAQNTKMSAMGLQLPSAEEVGCVRGNSARQTFKVKRYDEYAFVNEGIEEVSARLKPTAAVLFLFV